MRIAVYGRKIQLPGFEKFFEDFINSLNSRKVQFAILNSYADFLKAEYGLEVERCDANALSTDQFDCLISLGGDGTMLDTLSLVRNSALPVLGVNLGRLGFLASIKMNEFDAALDSLLKGEVEIDDRVVLELESDLEELQQFPYALNDVVVQKRDTSAMISVRTKLNGDRLNNYLADGLILATPTGSTGYNMSCGGPLLIPGSNSFVLTPIAAHNLTVRPVVIPDLGKLEFEVGDTSDTVLISLDSRSYQVDSGITFSVKRAHFKFRMYRLKGTTHMDTIRNKLLWGIDSRNR